MRPLRQCCDTRTQKVSTVAPCCRWAARTGSRCSESRALRIRQSSADRAVRQQTGIPCDRRRLETRFTTLDTLQSYAQLGGRHALPVRPPRLATAAGGSVERHIPQASSSRRHQAGWRATRNVPPTMQTEAVLGLHHADTP